MATNSDKSISLLVDRFFSTARKKESILLCTVILLPCQKLQAETVGAGN